VAYLFAGLLLGPVLRILEQTADHGGHGEGALEVIAEVGIVLLLFLVGLELSLDKIRDVGKVALAAGIGQVVFTAAGGTVMALLLGFSVIESIFLATALTFSSTVVVVKVLDQKGELDSLYGRIAVGIFLVQDLVVIVVLTILAGLGSAESMTVSGIWGDVAAGGVVAGRFVVSVASSVRLGGAVLAGAADLESRLVFSVCRSFRSAAPLAGNRGLSGGAESGSTELQPRSAAAGPSVDEFLHRGLFRFAGGADAVRRGAGALACGTGDVSVCAHREPVHLHGDYRPVCLQRTNRVLHQRDGRPNQ